MKNLLLIFMSTFMLIFFSLSALFAEKSELKWIQFQLNKYGYTAGKEDGVWGKATDKAFTLFMKDIGRSFNGKLRISDINRFEEEIANRHNEELKKSIKTSYDRESETKGPSRPGWKNNISPYDHSFAIVSKKDGHPVRSGKFSERFELRDKDCGGSDCYNPRYRSEIKLIENLASPDREYWYGWSFFNKNVPSYDGSRNLNLHFGQWKYGQTDKIMPAVKLHTNNSGDGYVWLQLYDMAMRYGKSYGYGGYVRTCRLWHLEANMGRWVDIVIHTNWSTTKDGYLNIWIDGTKKCEYRGQILASWENNFPRKGIGWGKHLSHRHGIFAGSTQKWDKNFSEEKKPTFVVYYDEFRQGKKREQVDIRMIKKSFSF